jgi:hypothetical protein
VSSYLQHRKTGRQLKRVSISSIRNTGRRNLAFDRRWKVSYLRCAYQSEWHRHFSHMNKACTIGQQVTDQVQDRVTGRPSAHICNLGMACKKCTMLFGGVYRKVGVRSDSKPWNFGFAAVMCACAVRTSKQQSEPSGSRNRAMLQLIPILHLRPCAMAHREQNSRIADNLNFIRPEFERYLVRLNVPRSLIVDLKGMLACRFVLGNTEAPLYPGGINMYLISMFYTRKESATYISKWLLHIVAL